MAFNREKTARSGLAPEHVSRRWLCFTCSTLMFLPDCDVLVGMKRARRDRTVYSGSTLIVGRVAKYDDTECYTSWTERVINRVMNGAQWITVYVRFQYRGESDILPIAVTDEMRACLKGYLAYHGVRGVTVRLPDDSLSTLDPESHSHMLSFVLKLRGREGTPAQNVDQIDVAIEQAAEEMEPLVADGEWVGD